MNTFQPGDLAMIMGCNTYWDGCIVKIVSQEPPPHNRTRGIQYNLEIAAFSPAMMDPSRRPPHQVIGHDLGAWHVDQLEIPYGFSALCTACKGNSFCEVTATTKNETIFHCSAHGYCSLRHADRTVQEAKWLTPTSKWAWFSVTKEPQAQNPQGSDLSYEPFCSCDVFNFGCSCGRLKWERFKK